MNEWKKHCIQELEKIVKLREKMEKELKNFPQGSLLVRKNKKTTQYYCCDTSKEVSERYIKKKDVRMINQLAQKDYTAEAIRTLRRNETVLMKFVECYDENALKQVYEKMPEERKSLVKPVILSDEMYVQAWLLSKEKELLESRIHDKYPLGEKAILTEKGELVRSKTEKIIADTLYAMGVPYVYEVPLQVGGVRKYPDFTVLNIKKRKEIYWEHFGMMHAESYVEKAVKKIREYHRENIFEGERLIVSFETSTQPLNSDEIKILIRKYLL